MSSNIVTLPMRDNDGSARQIVADNLAAELARKRISGRQASRALGVTQMYVARRVSGEVELSATDILWFASMLEISPAVLLQGAGPNDDGVGPAGIEPTTSTVESPHLAEVIEIAGRFVA